MGKKRIIIGDRSTLIEKVFFTFYQPLCRFALTILKDEHQSEDVVQDIFIKLHESSNSFHNELALKSFLYVSVRNKCLDVLRSRSRSPKQTDIDTASDESIIVEQELLDAASREECFRIIEAGIESLPSQSRRVMKMVLKGCSNMEISEELKISVNTVKTIKARSISTLRSKYGLFFLFLLSSFWG